MELFWIERKERKLLGSILAAPFFFARAWWVSLAVLEPKGSEASP